MKDVGSKRDKYVRKCGKPTGTVNGRKESEKGSGAKLMMEEKSTWGEF